MQHKKDRFLSATYENDQSQPFTFVEDELTLVFAQNFTRWTVRCHIHPAKVV